MKLRSLILAIFSSLALCSFTQEQQDEIILNSGKEYLGYICSQNFNNREVDIKTSLCIDNIERSGLYVYGPTTKKLDEISSVPLKLWLNKHSDYINISNSGEKTVMIYKLNNFHDAIILEENKDSVRYIIPYISIVTVTSKDIKTIKRSYEKEGNNGLLDVIETKDNKKFKGQIVENRLGEFIRIKTSDGPIQKIQLGNIKSIGKHSMAKELSIVSQSPFIETIRTKNNTYTGVITLQLYSTKGKSLSNTISITDNDNHIDSIDSYLIEKIERVPSLDPTLRKKIDNENVICLNGQEVAETKIKITQDNHAVIDSDKFAEAKRKHLVLNIDSISSIKLLVHDNSANCGIVIIKTSMLDVVDDHGERYEAFDFNQYDDIKINPTRSYLRMDGLRSIIFDKPNEGNYLVYRPFDKRVYWFELKKI